MSHDVLVAGETLIDWLPDHPGPLEEVSDFSRRPGGAPANVAVGLTRLEQTPLFWTRVGADAFGRYLESVLADAGVPDRFVERDSDAQTTLAFVTHDDSGDREFTFYRDGTADTRLEPGRIDDDTLEDLEWVHTGGVTLADGSARAATLDLLERAAAAGCTTSFDPNFRPELWPDEETFAHIGRAALAHVDVCKATVEELERLGFTGETPEAIARSVLEDGGGEDGGGGTGGEDDGGGSGGKSGDGDGTGPHTVFVTRGSEGAVAVTAAGSPWSADPAAVAHGGFDSDVVDTTGAGDAFVAGLIAAGRDGRSLEATLAFANAVAATATTDSGAMAALPTREAVESMRSEPNS